MNRYKITIENEQGQVIAKTKEYKTKAEALQEYEKTTKALKGKLDGEYSLYLLYGGTEIAGIALGA